MKFLAIFPVMLAKRRQNLELATLDASELAVLMSNAEREVINSIIRRREESGKGNSLFSLYKRLFL